MASFKDDYLSYAGDSYASQGDEFLAGGRDCLSLSLGIERDIFFTLLTPRSQLVNMAINKEQNYNLEYRAEL